MTEATTGRPTKLTPETQAKIVKAISDGNYYQTACELAGIHYTTFLDWMRRGEAGDPIFSDFSNALRKAESDAEAKIVSEWREQIPQDWRAGRDFLARRHPEKWGPKSYLDANVSGEIAHEHIHSIDAQILEVARKRGIDVTGGLDALADEQEDAPQVDSGSEAEPDHPSGELARVVHKGRKRIRKD